MSLLQNIIKIFIMSFFFANTILIASHSLAIKLELRKADTAIIEKIAQAGELKKLSPGSVISSDNLHITVGVVKDIQTREKAFTLGKKAMRYCNHHLENSDCGFQVQAADIVGHHFTGLVATEKSELCLRTLQKNLTNDLEQKENIILEEAQFFPHISLSGAPTSPESLDAMNAYIKKLSKNQPIMFTPKRSYFTIYSPSY